MKPLLALLAAVSFILPSCEGYPQVIDSPAARVALAFGASAIVAEAVREEPRMAPILQATADTLEGMEAPPLETFDASIRALASETIARVIRYYGTESQSVLVVAAIRGGLQIAEGRK